MNNIKPIYIYSGVALLLLFLFFSCSGKPDTEDELEERIELESSGRISLIDFEELHSHEQEIMGQDTYTISFKAKIRFEERCYIYVNKSGIGSFFSSFKIYKSKPEFIPSMSMILYSVEKGEEVEFKDRVTYFDTNDGWVAMDTDLLF